MFRLTALKDIFHSASISNKLERTYWFLISVYLLVMVAAYLAHFDLESRRRDLRAANQALEVASQERLSRVNQKKKIEIARKMLAASASAGLSYTSWDERRFNLKQVTMNRDQSEKLISQLGRSKTTAFGAEQFEISVKDSANSLFLPQPKGSSLVVTIHGTMLFSQPH